MENLALSDNKQYFTVDGKPFFWLGDTAWLMLQKLSLEECDTYLRNRAEKGFTVIQTVLVHTLPEIGKEESSLAPGVKNIRTEEYWEFVDKAVSLAEKYNLYLGLLPCWGSVVKSGILNLDNVKKYGNFLGKRYQNRKNIIWILGGDIRGNVNPEVYRTLGKTLKEYNPDRLVTYHPFGRTSSSLWFNDEDWLDFNMFQSGHRRYDQASLGEWDDNAEKETFFGEDNWKYVDRDLSNKNVKPTLDGEPSYEGIPKGLHNPRNTYWEEWDVRRYAYWSVFAGAAGHTYGSNAIMQFYRTEDIKGSYGVRESWQDAMHHPGAGQMQYLKDLMLSVDFQHGKQNDKILLFGQKERYHRIATFIGETYAFFYTYSGDEFMIDMSFFKDKKMAAYWMNPQDGTYSYITTLQNKAKWLASPVARKDVANDWVLVLREE